MSAGRSVCSLCRSFLLKEEPAPTSLPARSNKKSLLRLLRLGSSSTTEASEEEEKREPARELRKADLQRLPRSKYRGKTLVIANPASEVRYVKSIRHLLRSPVLGFDTESVQYEPKEPCLVQLASRDVCILWRLNKSSRFPTVLHSILSSPRFLKVGHSSEADAYNLLDAFSINTVNVFDTHTLVNSLPADIRPPLLSLQGLTGIFLGQWLSKSMVLSNWKQVKLSWQQLQYASTDAWVSLEVYLALMKYAADNGVTPPPPVECSLNLSKNSKRSELENQLKMNAAQAENARWCVEALLRGDSIYSRNRPPAITCDPVNMQCACARDNL